MQHLDGRRLILIADDNRDLAKGLSILLRLRGFEVETVHDGRDVLRAAVNRRPDAFLLDIGLPGMDGLEVAARIRSDEQFKDCLLISISAYDEALFDDPRGWRDFDLHLAKPVDLETIVAMLSSLG
jgi:CheY-like chemotaxis protein